MLWQRATGLGWINGQWSINANAFWPDLHSFGVFMATALFLGYGLLLTCAANLPVWRSSSWRHAAAVGLYLSGSRSTLFFVFCLADRLGQSVASIKLARVGAVRFQCLRQLQLRRGPLDPRTRLPWPQLRLAEPAISRTGLEVTQQALSNRPEIWAAAVHMYLGIPVLRTWPGSLLPAERDPGVLGQRIP